MGRMFENHTRIGGEGRLRLPIKGSEMALRRLRKPLFKPFLHIYEENEALEAEDDLWGRGGFPFHTSAPWQPDISDRF